MTSGAGLAVAALLVVMTPGDAKGKHVFVEIPKGFHGLVRIEFQVPACPYPEGRDEGRTIVISKEGRGCSRNDPSDFDHGLNVVYAGADRKTLPLVPETYDHDVGMALAAEAGAKVDPSSLRPLTKGPMDLRTVFIWSEMGGTCEDLKRTVSMFFVGTVSDYKKAGVERPHECRPTPWP